MAAGPGGVYREAMSWMETARDWRPTAHALAGLAAGALTGAVLGGLVIGWLAAVLSLVDGPTGGWELAWFYVVVVLAGPVLVLWATLGLSALQRIRFRAVLGAEIAAPPRPAGGGSLLLRPVRAWRAPATWRQLGYHLLAMTGGTAGGLLVAACWTAPVLALAALAGSWDGGRGTAVGLGLVVLSAFLFLVAPRVAGNVVHADEVAARALLGPSRSEELALRVESLARSRAEVVAATDAERRRIERDLHDGAQRRLVSLAMQLGMARASLGDDVPASLRQVIEQAHDEATEALAELRQLVRGLHPAVLDDRGLDAALSGIAAGAPLPVRLRVDASARCAPAIEAVAYFVVSEALTNVAKHAGASRAEVTVERAGDRLRVVVTDDGRGGATLDPGGPGSSPADPLAGSGAAANGGTGLRGLAQRAAAVDGTLTVDSPPGGPTRITVELPCGS
jgi:signal transduction histidine kinase